MADASQRVGIAHWAELCNGGGERVAWELARAFDTPLFVGHRDPSIEPDDVDVVELFDGLTRRAYRWGGLAQMAACQLAWESPPELREFDTLITSGSEPLAYVPPDGQTWISYSHHTSRWATDLLWLALERDLGRFARTKRTIAKCVRKAERALYAHYATKPDLFVVNSEVVARRLQRYWGVNPGRIRVVYPPVPVDEYGHDVAPTEDYYLTLSRLDKHKGLEQMIRAFAHLGTDYHLKIAGSGGRRDHLESIAADNVEFLGYIPEEEKPRLLSGAKAFVNNAYAEDFGITTVEALASGTPVLGVAEGMTQHLVLDRENGWTFPREGGHLRETVRRFDREGVEWSEDRIDRWADRFGVDRFVGEMHIAVSEARKRSRVNVDWEPMEQATPTPTPAADGGGE